MTIEEFLKVIKALGIDPSMSLEDAMAKIRGEGPAAPDPDAATEDAPPPAGDGGADESTEAAKAVEPPMAECAAPAPEDKATVAAAISRLTRTTGKGTIGEAVEEVELWRASHVKLEAETKKIAAEREALELGRRKENAAKLVALGAETPHTSGLAKGTLAKRLLDEPLDEQTARVAALSAARGGKLPVPPAADASSSTSFTVGNQTIELSEKELAMCSKQKLDPAKYAQTRAAMLARSHNTKGAS